MQDQPMNSTPSEAQAPMADDASGTPLDSIIYSVDGFMQDPKSATPEALGQLRADLEDLKTVLDQEEGGEPPAPPAPAGPPQAGMAATLGKMGGGR